MRIAFAVLVLVAAGCGGNNSTLSGTVSYRNKPVTSGMVVVLNPDRSAAKGEIAADGSYTVHGVGRGSVKVGVLSPDPAHHTASPKGSRRRKPAPTAGWVVLPEKYGNPGTSGVRFDVAGSETREIVLP